MKAKPRAKQGSLKNRTPPKVQPLSPWRFSWSRLNLIPLMLIVGWVPLIVHLRILPIEGIRFESWTGADMDPDFFNYWKVVAFLALTVITLLIMAFRFYRKDLSLRRTRVYLPIGLFSIMTILSTLFATHLNVAVLGYVSRYEGALVILGYMAVLFAAIHIVRSERSVRWTLGVFYASALVVGTIGIFQMLGHDLFASSFGKLLIFPPDLRHLAESMVFNLGERALYSTMYNSNYVGSYVAMVLPISVVIFLLWKDRFWRRASAFMALLMLAVLVGSRSRAGLAGVSVPFLLGIILLRKEIVRHWKLSTIAAAILVTTFVGANIVGGGLYFDRISRIFTDLFQPPSPAQLKTMQIEGNRLDITTWGYSLIVRNQLASIAVFDDQDNELLTMDVQTDYDRVPLPGDQYRAHRFSLYWHEEYRLLEITFDRGSSLFLVDGLWLHLIGPKGDLITLEEIPSWGFVGQERLGSQRGYNWSRSLPMIRDTLLLGHGPDTFAIHFPNRDYLGKMIAYGKPGDVLDKPHNLYLQKAIQTGLISLIALVALWGIYIVSSIRLYWRSTFSSFSEIAGLGIFLAITGYLAAGFFNDSVVSVAPVFWILLGVGISINLTLRAARKKQVEGNSVSR